MNRTCRRAAAALAACLALAPAVSPPARPALAAETGLDNRAVLDQREHLLAAFEARGPGAAPELVGALDSEAPLVRRTAAHLLVRLGPDGVPGLEEALENPDFLVRRIALDGLAGAGLLPRYLDRVIRDRHPSIRREVEVYWLEKHLRPLEGEARAEAIAAFDRAYRQEAPAVRRSLVRMLARLVPPADEARRILFQATRDEDEEVRQIAFRAVTEPTLERMRELEGARRWNELLEEFADEDFAAWPDARLAREALYLRGLAYHRRGEQEKAVAELSAAADVSPERRTLHLLGDIQRGLGEREKALDAYTRAFELGGTRTWRYYQVIISAAAILRDDRRFDEAGAVLERANPHRTLGHWGAAVNAAYGRTLAEQGDREGAIARYRRALELEGISASLKETVEAALAELER